MVSRRGWIDAFHDQLGDGGNGWTVPEEAFPDNDEIAGPDNGDGDYYPRMCNVFKALGLITPMSVRYLILGQDPYPTVDGATKTPLATGVAFDIPETCSKVPPSLEKIAKKLCPDKDCTDVKETVRRFNDWMLEEKILLLNTALTVPKATNGKRTNDVAKSHITKWMRFTSNIVAQLIHQSPAPKLVGWGDDARNTILMAMESAGVLSICQHPSYLPRKGKENSVGSFEWFWSSSAIGRMLRP